MVSHVDKMALEDNKTGKMQAGKENCWAAFQANSKANKSKSENGDKLKKSAYHKAFTPRKQLL